MRAEFKSNEKIEIIDLGNDTDFAGITCLDCNVNTFLDLVFDDINFKVLNFKVFDFELQSI